MPLRETGPVSTPVGIHVRRAACDATDAHDVSHYLRPGTLCLPALPPLALYVHFPWCVRKCPYCDFNSHEPPGGSAAVPEARYLQALRADLEAALPLVWGRPIVSVFIGGGTPSLLSARRLDELLSFVRALLPLQPDCEITLEANPGAFEAEKFAAYRASGVNRLSIGVQSLQADRLAALGRIHDPAQARAAIDVARRHFDNFNCDLMYALPGQTLDAAQREVEELLALAGPHLSLYQLTIEPNTVFAKYPPQLPDEDTAAAIHDWIEARMARAGYRHYEVSAYARPGFESRHNLNYWTFGDYLGIGPGAHSKIASCGKRACGNPLRTWSRRRPAASWRKASRSLASTSASSSCSMPCGWPTALRRNCSVTVQGCRCRRSGSGWSRPRRAGSSSAARTVSRRPSWVAGSSATCRHCSCRVAARARRTVSVHFPLGDA